MNGVNTVLMRNQILLGDCLEVLKQYPDSFFHSIVTDPPYALGTKDPTLEDILAYLQGSSIDMGGDLMNKDWELPTVLLWKECFRVLKPGGFLLAFAATRTMDLMSIGIRAAGFENRDTLTIEQGPPVLRWIRAQGMPKNMDISKFMAKNGDVEGAKIWKGWGTALKPYWEPILMFRKPVEEKTIADQVESTGTGGINIDASRVRHSNKSDLEKHKASVEAVKQKGGVRANSWKNSSDLSGANDVSDQGRWPSNVLLVHSDACTKVGTEKVAMPPINKFDDGAKPFGGGAGHKYTVTERPDEEVEVWSCHASCPVSVLTEQRGITKSNPVRSKIGSRVDTRNKGWNYLKAASEINDQGSVGRFFKNFSADFFYVPKPSESDKNKGLEDADLDNEHLTVKPIELMSYLVRMVTPNGGVVLDPYCGSGSTCVAAAMEGFSFVGIEKEEPSYQVAKARSEKALQDRLESDIQRSAFDLAMSADDDE